MASRPAPRRTDPNEKIRKTIQRRIRQGRRKLRLSEKELGLKIGVDEVTIKRWEGSAKPHTVPKVSEGRVLADKFGVSLDWITGNQTDPVADASSVAAWAEREREAVRGRIDQLMRDLTSARTALIEETAVEAAARRAVAQGAKQHG